jgi:hypothetical protein
MAVLGAVERFGGASTYRGNSINAEIPHLAVNLRVVQNPRGNDKQDEQK